MYEVTSRLLGGQLIVKYEAENMKELFDRGGKLYEMLGSDDACGKCGSKHIHPRMRTAGEYQYYELVCGDFTCGAKLSFGQIKKTLELFPKRRAKDGSDLANRGWIIYRAIAAPAGEESDEAEDARTTRSSSHDTTTHGPSRPAPSRGTAAVQDSAEVAALLADPTQYEKVISDLFFAIVDAYGEADANGPKSAACWKQCKSGNASDADVIRRLFRFKVVK